MQFATLCLTSYAQRYNLSANTLWNVTLFMTFFCRTRLLLMSLYINNVRQAHGFLAG